MDLQLGWPPRDQNIEADALTNGEFVDFDPNLRLAVDVERLRFPVLSRMMAISEELYAETQRMRAAATGSRATSLFPRLRTSCHSAPSLYGAPNPSVPGATSHRHSHPPPQR